MRRICVIVTARPSYSRIKTALEAMRDHSDIDLQIVVAASALLDRYGRVVDVMRKDGFEISDEIYSVVEGGDVSQLVRSVGVGLIELPSILSRLKPDAVVTIADRYETIANAISASFMNIPLVHIQGGEFTGSIDNKVRHAITKLADVHLVASEVARNRVISMGEDPQFVINTGCPSIDLAAEIARESSLKFDPFDLYSGTGNRFDLSDGYVVVLQHPVTTEHDQALNQSRITLDAVRALKRPVFWFWPNVDAGSDGTSKALRMFREENGNLPFHFFKNMLPQDFLRLILNSDCLIGNSSVGIRESAFLGVPVVDIGTRQIGRERGANVMNVDHDAKAIHSAAEQQIAHGRYERSYIYGDGNAGAKISETLSKISLRIEKRDFTVPPRGRGQIESERC